MASAALPGSRQTASVARGQGMAYVHYKHSETYVAMGMVVAVERATGRIKVDRVVCAHDCGQIINPDGVRAQVEGNVLQTLSRVLMEEVKFDRSRVTSTDWSSYPIMTFSDVPSVSALSEASLAICRRSARSMRSRNTILDCSASSRSILAGSIPCCCIISVRRSSSSRSIFGLQNDVSVHASGNLVDFLLRRCREEQRSIVIPRMNPCLFIRKLLRPS